MAETLEQQDALRRRLTTDIAHELRTPLSSLSAYLEAMEEGVWEATPERLQQVLQNLLSNAVKYSESGGEIVIRTGETEDTAFFP